MMRDEEENAMLIKEMVTHLQESRRTTALEDPYESSPTHTYYTTEIVKHHHNHDSMARDHILNSLYFLQLLYKYNNPLNQPEILPLNLIQKQEYQGKITVVFDLD